jgi:hypothetical protein
VKRITVLLLAVGLVAGCSKTAGIVEEYCDGFTQGVSSGNEVAMGLGLPGPVNPPCPEAGVEVIPENPTPAQVWCYGRLAGFVAVGAHHFPGDSPTPAWIVNYLNACMSYREGLDEEP